MKEKIKALKAAFPVTIPVLTGYLFLGMAYGILMNDKGFHLGWILLNSVVVYAGSMQFVGIGLLTLGFQPLHALFMTLMVNARHLFYGISMLGKYKGIGKQKPYLIFGLTDETFSIVCSTDAPKGVAKEWFFFFITFLNQCYWVLGSILGGILGQFIGFDTTGLDFALTALFVVIFVNQWLEQKDHTPALVGVFATVISLVVCGPDQFIIPAMIMILAVLTIFRSKLEKRASV